MAGVSSLDGAAVTGRVTLPNFVVIGAMRSGTTTLATLLRTHPAVHLCRPKEPHFFDLHWDRGLDWYRSLFAGWNGQRAIGEATPAYQYDPVALERLAATLPGVRLVAILRNPVDRAYSHYWHRRARGVEPLTFTDALAAEPQRLARGDRRARMDFSYVDRGRYLAQLQRAAGLVGRGRLHVLLLDDLRAQPRAAYAGVCRFLDIDDTYVPSELGRQVNAHVRFRSVRLRTWSLRLPRPLRRAVGKVNAEPDHYPPLDPAVRRALAEKFAPEVEQLAVWLDRDLSAWLP